MKSTKHLNPFKPGTGELPPYLAGRENVQNTFRSDLSRLSAGRSPSAPIILYGPSGMGKTVLLNWFEYEIKHGQAKKDLMRVVQTTPFDINTRTHLWKSLLKPSIWGSHDYSNPRIQEDLIKQCKKRPLVYLIDEFQCMDTDVYNFLLNEHQIVSAESPFMLVLSGAPGLVHFQSNINSGFIERANYIWVDRLDIQSATEAISIPLKEHGIEITDDALSFVVEDSQCYPYFLSKWGSALWVKSMESKLSCVTKEHVATIKLDIKIIEDKFYDYIRGSLKGRFLKLTAVAIAKAYQEHGAMTKDQIVEIIKENLSVDSLSTRSIYERLDVFAAHGFVSQSGVPNLYEPSHPRLMDYMVNTEIKLRAEGRKIAEERRKQTAVILAAPVA